MRPPRVLRLCVGDRWQLAGQVKVAVVAALLADKLQP